jgi:Rap1a immunity proteins
MRQTLVALCALAVVVAYPAKACAANSPEITGQNLYDMCTDKSRDVRRLCETWIYGFARGMAYSQILAGIQHVAPTTCVSYELTGEQARLVIEKFMRDHPEDLHHQAAAIAGIALALAFPCKN